MSTHKDIKAVSAGFGAAEGNCTENFWEGIFKSQALLDEKYLIACMAYIDLNPVRAKMAPTPEASIHTSVKLRCDTLKDNTLPKQPECLMPFVGNPREPMPQGLPFHLNDYLSLVDWSGKIIREGKRGSMNQTLPPILDRLDIGKRQTNCTLDLNRCAA